MITQHSSNSGCSLYYYKEETTKSPFEGEKWQWSPCSPHSQQTRPAKGIRLKDPNRKESSYLDDSAVDGWEHFAKLLQLFTNQLQRKGKRLTIITYFTFQCNDKPEDKEWCRANIFYLRGRLWLRLWLCHREVGWSVGQRRTTWPTSNINDQSVTPTHNCVTQNWPNNPPTHIGRTGPPVREGATPPAGTRTAEPGGSGCEN